MSTPPACMGTGCRTPVLETTTVGYRPSPGPDPSSSAGALPQICAVAEGSLVHALAYRSTDESCSLSVGHSSVSESKSSKSTLMLSTRTAGTGSVGRASTGAGGGRSGIAGQSGSCGRFGGHEQTRAATSVATSNRRAARRDVAASERGRWYLTLGSVPIGRFFAKPCLGIRNAVDSNATQPVAPAI